MDQKSKNLLYYNEKPSGLRVAQRYAYVVMKYSPRIVTAEIATMGSDSTWPTPANSSACSRGCTAAAVFVVTREDIRRSGATSISELLRMVPGLQVARLDANEWAISARGFNDRFADKLLVLIDGRTVYTPVFSGVYWDVQDTLLEDIDRIVAFLRQSGILSVGDMEKFAQKGGVINFVVENNRVGFGINVEAGKGAGLRISSKLLSLARIVRDSP